MSINQRIMAALSRFGLPVIPGVDTGSLERCITFNYDLIPAQFAGNRPAFYRALVQIHLLLPLPENSVGRRMEIAAALAEAGLTWPEIIDATDEHGQHYVFECEAITGKE